AGGARRWTWLLVIGRATGTHEPTRPAAAPDQDRRGVPTRPARNYAEFGKWGFSMMPSRFPNGSFTVATWIPSPTSWGAATAVAPSASSRGHDVVIRSTPQ